MSSGCVNNRQADDSPWGFSKRISRPGSLWICCGWYRKLAAAPARSADHRRQATSTGFCQELKFLFSKLCKRRTKSCLEASPDCTRTGRRSAPASPWRGTSSARAASCSQPRWVRCPCYLFRSRLQILHFPLSSSSPSICTVQRPAAILSSLIQHAINYDQANKVLVRQW